MAALQMLFSFLSFFLGGRGVLHIDGLLYFHEAVKRSTRWGQSCEFGPFRTCTTTWVAGTTSSSCRAPSWEENEVWNWASVSCFKGFTANESSDYLRCVEVEDDHVLGCSVLGKTQHLNKQTICCFQDVFMSPADQHCPFSHKRVQPDKDRH